MAGVWLADVPILNYDDTLFRERSPCSVTANTRRDGEEFLALAERFAIRPEIVSYPMSDAPRALSELAYGRFQWRCRAVRRLKTQRMRPVLR